MKREKFQKSDLKEIRISINEALAEVVIKFDLSELSIGNIGFSNFEFSCKLTGKLQNEESVKIDEFINTQDSNLLGFNKNIVGEMFTANGKIFVIRKLDLGRPKFPIIAEGPDKKLYKFQDRIKGFISPDVINRNNLSAV